MNIAELTRIIEKRAPLSLQAEWDNSGWQLLCAGPKQEIGRVLVALEMTPAVVKEAREAGAEVVITHHPLIFSSLHRVDSNEVTGNLICSLIRAGISVYASHTPFDRCRGGNNDYLAALLHLQDVALPETDEEGYLRVGYVDGECDIAEYTQQLVRWLGLDRRSLRFCGDAGQPAAKIAVCTGAGGDFIYAAHQAGCDLFITGDLKYHTAQTAKELGLNVLDIGHYGSEKIFIDNMCAYLRTMMADGSCEIIASKLNLDPFDQLL